MNKFSSWRTIPTFEWLAVSIGGEIRVETSPRVNTARPTILLLEAFSLRQASRHSSRYKACIKESKLVVKLDIKQWVIYKNAALGATAKAVAPVFCGPSPRGFRKSEKGRPSSLNGGLFGGISINHLLYYTALSIGYTLNVKPHAGTTFN